MSSKLRRNLAGLLAVVCLSALVPHTSAYATTGVITGTVTGPSGEAVWEAGVLLYTYDSASSSWIASDSRATLEDGTYAFSVDAGTYRVGFHTYRMADEYAFDARDLQSADDIVVGDGETKTVDAQLSVGGVIEGRVSDSDGNGIEMDVHVYQQIDGVWSHMSDVESGESGSYRVPGLNTGTYRLKVSNRTAFAETFYKDASTIEDADDVQVVFEQTTSGIDFQPAERGRVTGLVTDANGLPIEGVSVSIFEFSDGQWSDVNGVRTRTDGSYRIHAPHSGAYRLGFSGDSLVSEFYDDSATIGAADDVEVTDGSITPGIDAVLATIEDPEEPPEEPEEPACTIGDPDATGAQRLRGTAGADVICGGAGNDSISALGGDDVILAGVGNDRINGGSGADQLSGGAGSDLISGAAGNDSLEGNAGRDTLSAGSGNDYLHGGGGDDKLYGSTNNDRLNGGQGTDSLNGGFGTDDCLDDEFDRLGNCETYTDEPE
jgi:Ca2+-binding RTX toxin-like protein